MKTFLIITPAALQTPPAVKLKWDEKTWPQTAIDLELVLVGWGPNMPSIPTQDWLERKRGGLTQINWENLVKRIPQSWRENPNYAVADNELELRFMSLDEFLTGSPGMLCFPPLNLVTHTLSSLEYQGRYPCIVDHVGRVLFFAEEAKSHLKATAPRKHSGKRLGKTKQKEPTPASSSDESEQSESERRRHPTHFVPSGDVTPSGNYRKRARVERPIARSLSPPIIQGEARPIKAIPTRGGDEARKRKRSDTANVEVPEQRWQHATPVLQPSFLPQHVEPSFVNQGHAEHPIMAGFLNPPNHLGTPMFPPPFAPSPFSAHPPYAQHGGFQGPGYAPPYFPPQYAHQNWHVPQPNNGPQPWGSQAPYGHDEVDGMLQMRRGGFNNT